MYTHYQYLLKEANKLNIDTTIFKSFITNSLIIKITELNTKDYHLYLKKLRKEKAFNNLLQDTKSRKIKAIFLKISPKLYYKLIRK